MTMPLSPEFDNLAPGPNGIYSSVRDKITPRGSYTIQGVGDPNKGYSGYGYFWGPYMDLTSGTSDAGSISTDTGSPVGTPSPVAYDVLKVGGGPTGAVADDGIPSQGMSQGGTASPVG
jgi:hypothetical protein